MNNNLTVVVQVINDNFVIRYNEKKENKANELMIKQKINSLTKEIFSNVDNQLHHIKQINFLFKENNEIKVVIKHRDGNFEYDLRADTGALHRAQELAMLVNKTTKIAQVIHPKSAGLEEEKTPPSASLYTPLMISKIFHSIERWYISTFYLKIDVDPFFKDIKHEIVLKDRWRTSQQYLADQVNALDQQWNKGRTNELFSKEELFGLVSQKLEKSFTSHYHAITHKVISEREMTLLKNERTLLGAISRIERAENEDEINQSEIYWARVIDTIPAIDFPIEQLAQINMTIQTEKHLIHTWDRILKELADKGDLNHIVDLRQKPVEGMKQIRFADAYIRTTQLLPKQFHDVFQQFHILNPHRLEKFIRTQPNALELKSLAHDELGKERELILQECVRPFIDQFHQQLLDNHMDFIPLVSMIKDQSFTITINTGDESTPNLLEVNLIDHIEAAIKQKSISADKREQLGLTKEKLINFIIFDLEQIGMEHFLISNEQMIHLREMRESLAIKDQLMEQIDQQIFECRVLAQEISETEQKLNTILKKASPYGHVSSSLSSEQVELLNDYLEKIKNKIQSIKNRPFKDKEQTQLLNESQLIQGRLEEILEHPSSTKEQKQLFNLLSKHQQQTKNLDLVYTEMFETVPILEFPIESLNQFNISDQDLKSVLWGTLLKKLDATRKDESQSNDVKGQAQFKFRVVKRMILEQPAGSHFSYQMAKELERLEKPVGRTQEIINRLNQEMNLEQWKEEIQTIKPSDIQFELLATTPITQANAEFIFALWTHLINKSIEPIEKDRDQIRSSENFSLKNVKKYEDALFSYRILNEILKNVSNPLIVEKIQSLQSDTQKVVSQTIQIKIMNQVKKLFPLDKSLKLTNLELLIGDVQKTPVISIQSNPVQKKKELTLFEIQGLQLLSKALSGLEHRNETLLSVEESKQLDDFIEFARKPGAHRKALNAKLRDIMHGEHKGISQLIQDRIFTPKDKRLYKHIPFGISSAAVDMILGVTYQLRNSDQFELIAKKLELLLHKIDKKEPISSKEQMTIKELGILIKCIKIGDDKTQKSLLTKLQEIIEHDNAHFIEYSQISKRAEELLERLNQKFNEESFFYKDGDFVAKVGAKEHELLGHQTTGMERLHFTLVTPFSHGAKIYIQEKAPPSKNRIDNRETKLNHKVKLSEVLGTYNQGDYEFLDDICAEVWRLDISKMIPQSQKELLSQVYGKEWAQTLQEKYESIENRFHGNANRQFKGIINPWERRLQAGKADYIWGGHIQNGETDFKDLADVMLGKKKNTNKEDRLKEMICSEFVTKSTLTALVQLNTQISEDIKNWNDQQEEKNKVNNSENILELPISTKEDLSRVHPGRMIDLFKKTNCIRKLKSNEKPAIVQQIIRAT